jgi:hypothetical protein
MAPAPEYLVMIQSIITRMAQNSFLIKGWSVTFAAGLLGLSSADDNTDLAWIAVGSVAVFAVLDAYYLAIESEYRDLYARAIEPGAPSWTLATAKADGSSVLAAMVSPSVWLPHGAALLAAMAVSLLA